MSKSRPEATFWVQLTEGVTYYRARLPARHLPGKVCTFDECPVLDVRNTVNGIQFPRQEGAAVFSFPGSTTRALLIAEMMNQGIPVYVELDDNYQVPPPFVELTSSQWCNTRAERQAGKDQHNYETVTDVCRVVDGMIVSTPRLAELYADVNENIHVCPNAIDPDDWPEPVKPDDGVLRIGWAASDSHRHDAPLIRDALVWASTQPGVEVVILGIHPELTRYRFPYTYVPWTNSLAAYRRSLSVLDVALCPVIPSEWSDCKSDVKALEAAMAGACPVVGRTEPYRPWWERTFVAEQQWDWRKIVKHLVRNRDEVRETAASAREYVLAERSYPDAVRPWKEALCRTGYAAALT